MSRCLGVSFNKALVVLLVVLRQRSLFLGLQPRLVTVELFQLPGHLPVEEIQGDVHGAGALALGAAGAAPGQVHGPDDVPGGVPRRAGRTLHRLGAVLVAEALLAVAEGADLAAGHTADAAAELFLPVGPALGRGQGFEPRQLRAFQPLQLRQRGEGAAEDVDPGWFMCHWPIRQKPPR